MRSALWLALLTPLAAAHGQVLREWRYDDPQTPLPHPQGCELRRVDSLLHGELPTANPATWLWLPAERAPAPLALVLRLRRSSTLHGRGEVHTRTTERPDLGFHSVVRFALPSDGQWHEVRVALPAVGTVEQLRLAVGQGPGSFDLAWIRLEQDPYPAAELAGHAALPGRVELADDALAVSIDLPTHRWEVLDRRTRRRWVGDGGGTKALLVGARQVNPHEALLELYDHSVRARFTCRLTLPEPGVLRSELDTPDQTVAFFGPNQYPPALRSDLPDGRVLFCDRSAGVWADQRDATYRNWMLTVYGNTATCNLPLIGVLSASTGEGLMALVETPTDALFHLVPDAAQRCWPQIHWDESLDTFRYPRRLSYHFLPSGGYVALAARYRDYARGQGRVLPFSEKVRQRPQVARLAGAPILWGGRDAWRMIQEARPEGMLGGLLANAQHGLFDDSKLRALNAQGYLTAPYDNFSDALDGPTAPGRDPAAEVGLRPRPDAGPAGGWEDELHKYFVRSSAFARRTLEANQPREQERYGYNAWFIDVSMAINLGEDWHPQHTYDRRADLAYRRECFQWLRDRGLVVGTEHGNDWGVDLVDWTEGALGGPFWWQRTNDTGWEPGRLRRVASRDDYSPAYRQYGLGLTTRVPLWQLVYHDCVVSTWYWGDAADYHYDAAPEVSDQKDLWTMLYGGAPLLWRAEEGYGWNRHRERLLQSYRDTCLLHRAVAFARLTDHQFLSADGALQRTQFSSGHTVVVNFGETPQPYRPAGEAAVTLAPRGWWIAGPGLRQSRLLVDGQPLKELVAPDYRVLDAPAGGNLTGLRATGRVVAFRTAPDRWQLALGAGQTVQVQPTELTGWSPGTPLAVWELDDLGQSRRLLQVGDCGQGCTLQPTATTRFYALQRDPDPLAVTVYPTGTVTAGARVLLAAPTSQAMLRSTLDGSPPTATSPEYREPLEVPASAQLSAQLFAGRQPLGLPRHERLSVVQPLYSSPLLRGGDAPQAVDVPLAGCSELWLRLGDGGDHCWSDYADWAEAAFVRADGSRVYLSDLPPLVARQSYFGLGRDGNPPPQHPLRINGQTYAKGLGCFAEADLRYAVPPDAQRFVATVGVDDRGNPPAGSPAVLRGSVTFQVSGLRGALRAAVQLRPVNLPAVGPTDRDQPPIACEFQAPWMDGPARLRLPEVLVSSLGCHFVDHLLPGPNALRPLHQPVAYPVWQQDAASGALRYDRLLPEGLEFGCTVTPQVDGLDLEFRATNRTAAPITWLSANACLQFHQVPLLHARYDLDRLLVLRDGRLQPLGNTTPTPAERQTTQPWLHLLSRRGLQRYTGPRDLGSSWLVDQVADDTNLMAVATADGQHLVGYTWELPPDVLMSNCGFPCLHTGPGVAPAIASGATWTVRGRIYLVPGDRDALVARCQRDQAAWAARGTAGRPDAAH
ncbi:MAG: NPCBM/NEW2 domain-containing protein [Fimbriimonadaceae bacterium]|nr:NPCBM/NEW2 domain-containing protein [Fimbriimonadaceae bacterium]